ncbi:hypothetical protein GCM10023116_19140 [Kistimonas scapharcae]|uniref:Uncharacterized protein n=1 Tax=Kistimonas scapharcae TaxID=1036133 RepID=A0ABP8V0A0_9GAMM
MFYLIFRHLTIYTVTYTYTVDGYDERITQPAYRQMDAIQPELVL